MASQNPKNEYTVLVVDNDECIGAWSLGSAIHDVVANYISKHTGIPTEKCVQVFKKYFVEHYMSNGGARPGTKDMLKLLKFHKDIGSVDRVVMFTSCTNTNGWVNCLKECLEMYAGVSVYDMVLHRDNTESKETADGATVKSMDMVLERLGFQTENTKIIVIDDRPQNIQGSGVRIAVSPYRHVVDENHIVSMLDDILDTLQEMYQPQKNVKTYNPIMFKKMLKELLLGADGRKEDVRKNIFVHNVPVDQRGDKNLIKQCMTTFLNHVEPPALERSTSEYPEKPTQTSRSISA